MEGPEYMQLAQSQCPWEIQKGVKEMGKVVARWMELPWRAKAQIR